MRSSVLVIGVLLAAATMMAATARSESIVTVPVGNVDNANDGTGYGSVSYQYNIGKYDVTNAQYAEFLSAKATSSDPYGLWNSDMNSWPEGGINRSGSGPYTYTVKPGQENQPVVCVTWYSTLRFANWLNNGQGNGSTETGSYTLLGGTPTPSNATTISRNPGAEWVLPSENEWYKAAYYDPTLNSGSGGYWLYPTKSNTPPTSQAPPGGSNSANFWDSTTGSALTHTMYINSSYNYLTDVGAYATSLSAYGTLDQAGDAWQWNEADSFGDGSKRGIRGGSWGFGSDVLASSISYCHNPTGEANVIGFRVAEVPEPGSLALLAGVALTALLCWRRRK